MRGEYGNPVASTGHASAYAALQDRDHLESASMCGACHDITVPAGAAIERTYSEWQGSIFSDPDGGETCGQCHMNQSTTPKPIAQAPGVGPREYHAHDFPAVDALYGTHAMPGWVDPKQLADGQEFRAVLRIDTPGEAEYYRHGGIMQYVLRSLLAS